MCGWRASQIRQLTFIWLTALTTFWQEPNDVRECKSYEEPNVYTRFDESRFTHAHTMVMGVKSVSSVSSSVLAATAPAPCNPI